MKLIRIKPSLSNWSESAKRSHWSVRHSRSAMVVLASPNMMGHSSNRSLVTTISVGILSENRFTVTRCLPTLVGRTQQRKVSGMNRIERRRAEKVGKKTFEAIGMSADNRNPYVVASHIRSLASKLESSKQSGNISPFVEHLYRSVELTRNSLSQIAVACQNGCSHCCNGWVTSSAPEILHLAKIIKKRGDAAIERVKLAFEATNAISLQERNQLHLACPLLLENSCSVYPDRPKACRMAASQDAQTCFRVFKESSGESIPTPALYITGLAAHVIALAAALRHGGFPPLIYEFTSGLHAALLREDAEKAWLAGEAVFSAARTEPGTAFDSPHAEMVYRLAFP